MLIFLSLLASLASQFVSGVNAAPTIQLGKTTLVGREIASVQQEFFGNIPYAEPPLANLRFNAPVPKLSLNPGTFNATQYGPACLQVATGLAPNQMSEDCLTINFIRPSGTSANSKLPVMFWTYGGGFVGGQSSTANASLIVAQSVARGTPIIFVSFNYRLGPLGFPQGQEAANRGSVNLGIKDQIAALEWVQLHIETFGGDKDKVTLFGQSAGSIMMSILFLHSWVGNLARAAIFESGYQGTVPLFPPSRGEVDWQNFVGGVPSCAATSKPGSTFGCLAEANTTEILQAFALASTETVNVNAWSPVLDGPLGLIPALPSVLFKLGLFARLPFIAGTVLDEGTTFVPQTVNSTQELAVAFGSLFSPSSSPTTLQSSLETLLQLYPDDPALGSPFDTGNETFGLSSAFKRASAVVGDSDFQSQRRLWIETASKAGVKTFGYLFTEPQPTSPPVLGVFHASELLYVYGKPSDTSTQSEQLSRIMTDYWVSFVASLTPNDGLGVPRPEWTQFTPQNNALIQLNGANLTMIPDTYRAEQIAFFNSNPTIWRR
ncbi:Carboxylic ester hydrolase [Mycena venus]|uniref:Carboxylic ester hydrolase n=1 Tax=Mycena venus TaxID=2733690 RepID=A0A8H6YGP6_9AGAR|nr:Carboxylic ester hydrolase [Mycena venus]